ncbi:MAG: hypothetical protein IT454_15200 [Planctomycetes bacterium]|nr:hypothetical protein [Planctomycetota bacterium]
MNTPQPQPPPRIVRAAAAEVAPLYPARRILGAEALQAEELTRTTREECAALRREAEELLEGARAEARKLSTGARRNARIKLEKAREEGLRSGAESFAAALLELQRTADELRRQAALDARKLGVRFAKAILDVEFHVHPERILDLVESLLRRGGNPAQLEVRLHPRDAALVRPRLAELRERSGVTSQIRVLEDETQVEHSVRVESSAGVWEGGADLQLAPLLERLEALERQTSQTAKECAP